MLFVTALPKTRSGKLLRRALQAVAGIEGVAGIHLMGHKNEAALAQIIAESGLRQAPQAAAVA